MNRISKEELVQIHEQVCNEARELMKKKNSDYSGAHESVFGNFLSTEALGITSTEQGMLVRMGDKMSRLATFCKTGKLEVVDENVFDTLRDMVNYPILMYAYLLEKKRNQEHAND